MRRVPVLFLALSLMLAVGALNAQDTRTTVFPQLGVGGGWSCDFFVTNQGLRAVSGVKLSFFDDAANALVVQAADLGSASNFQFNLQPGETKVIRVTGGSSVVAGYATLVGPYLSTVRATMVVRLGSGGQTSTQLGVSEQYPFTHFSFAAEQRSSAGVSTGLALVNVTLGTATPAAQDLVITAIDNAGVVKGTKILTLAAGAHTSLFLNDARLFPGLDNFVGTVVVSGSHHMGLLALRLENAALGAVSINEGAVLSPFMVTQTATSETEANDTLETANAIANLPAALSGVISTKEDQDHFRVTLRKGDVVTILVEAEALPGGSELDSEVFLLNSSGATVATNDQNGLGGPLSSETNLPQNDSFVRTVVPADGTYYIRIWDWAYEFGGAAFVYKLHITTQAP